LGDSCCLIRVSNSLCDIAFIRRDGNHGATKAARLLLVLVVIGAMAYIEPRNLAERLVMRTCAIAFLLLSAGWTMSGQSNRPQHDMPPRANQGHLPPAPPRTNLTHGINPRREERLPDGHVNQSPHVSHDLWYGNSDPADPRFQLHKPYEHGRFPHPGLGSRYSIPHIDRNHHRFWFGGGYYFEVAAWDWPFFTDWCWECGGDFVIYDDPDHPGWYLLYNIHTGVYVHVLYLGLQ